MALLRRVCSHGLSARFTRQLASARVPDGSPTGLGTADNLADQSFAGAMAPYRPENWAELLSEAQQFYPERTGPRRTKRAKRQKLRQAAIRRQHANAKNQRQRAHLARQAKIKSELFQMREAYIKYNFAPASQCAQHLGPSGLKMVGLGGRLGERYFGPIIRDGNLRDGNFVVGE